MGSKISENDLDRLRQKIQEKLEWGSVDSWHSSMFEELSTKVFEATQELLSVPTLKRFFKVVNHEGSPSIHTLDVLSRFVGEGNWRSFRLKGTKHVAQPSGIPSKSVYITIGFILALVTIGLIGNKRPEVVINASEFTFSSRVLSNTFPNSVVFDFEIPGTLRADSFSIQQYWDPSKTISIRKEQKQATGIYYFPGYFKAKLLVDDQIAKEHDLFLKSEGWLGLIEYDPTPKYFNPIQRDAGLFFTEEITEEVKSQSRPVVSSFHFIDDLGSVSGDNFSFSTTIKNTFDDRWAVCQAVYIYFIGTTGAMIIPFSKIGCSSDNNLMLNDVYLKGKEHDLSSLSADFTTPVRLGVEVKEQSVAITIGDKEVYIDSYTSSMGRLVGLRFKFIGLGEVQSYEILDERGAKIQL